MTERKPEEMKNPVVIWTTRCSASPTAKDDPIRDHACRVVMDFHDSSTCVEICPMPGPTRAEDWVPTNDPWFDRDVYSAALVSMFASLHSKG